MKFEVYTTDVSSSFGKFDKLDNNSASFFEFGGSFEECVEFCDLNFKGVVGNLPDDLIWNDGVFKREILATNE